MTVPLLYTCRFLSSPVHQSNCSAGAYVRCELCSSPIFHTHFPPISCDSISAILLMHCLVGLPLFHPNHTEPSPNPIHEFFTKRSDISHSIVVRPTPKYRIHEIDDNLNQYATIFLTFNHANTGSLTLRTNQLSSASFRPLITRDALPYSLFSR